MFLQHVQRFHLSRFLLLRLCSFFVVLTFVALTLALPLPSFAVSNTLATHAAHAANIQANDSITITAQTETLHFPSSIDFQMTAIDTSSTINDATLFITFGNQNANFEDQHDIHIKNPAQAVTVSWHEDTSGQNFVPPGIPVSYHWLVQDSIGTLHTDTDQQFSTIDNRFSWQHLTQGLLQVNWYGRPTDFGQQMLNQAESSLAHISSVLGSGPQQPINLWVYQTDIDFHGSLAPGSFEWVGGVAYPSWNEASIVVQDTYAQTLIRDMPHELTHIVFHQLISQGNQDVPRWFDEGLAVYNQLYHEQEMTTIFQTAIETHTLIPLSTIATTFPASAVQATLAYAESWNLLTYMYDTFGSTRMMLLIRALKNPTFDFNQSLTRALGEDEIHLENQWRAFLHQPPVSAANQTQATPEPPTQATPPPITPQRIPAVGSGSLLIGIGLLLILSSIIVIIVVLTLTRMKRVRQKAWAVEMAQQIITSSLTDNSYRPGGADPYRFSWQQDRQQSPPSPPLGYVPQQGQPPSPSAPILLPPTSQQTPASFGQWPGNPSSPPTLPSSGGNGIHPAPKPIGSPETPEQDGSGNQTGEQTSPSAPFVPNQEYPGQMPKRQRPQE